MNRQNLNTYSAFLAGNWFKFKRSNRCWPSQKIKHLQTQPVGVFCFTSGRDKDLGESGGCVLKNYAWKFV